MTLEPILIAMLLGGLAVVLVVEAVAARRGHPQDRVNRRLSLLAGGGDARVVLRKLSRRPMQGDNHDLALALLRIPPIRALDHLAARAGLLTPIEHLLVALGLSVVAAVLACLAAGIGPELAVPAGPVGAVVVWVLVLRRLARRRNARFAEQFPKALTLISRSLRAGHPLSTALSLVAREMPDPLGSEFGMVFDEMTYGQDLRGALANLCRRVDGRELRYMAVAISIQQSTGGNLAQLLDSLAGVLHEVERMHRKVRALSAEGRLSALVLSVLPFAVAFGIALLAPGYYDEVFRDRPFLIVLCLGGAGIGLGILMMVRMVNFRF
jgi:tight adherence protein B